MPKIPKTTPPSRLDQQPIVKRTDVTGDGSLKRGLTGNPNPKGEPKLPKK